MIKIRPTISSGERICCAQPAGVFETSRLAQRPIATGTNLRLPTTKGRRGKKVFGVFSCSNLVPANSETMLDARNNHEGWFTKLEVLRQVGRLTWSTWERQGAWFRDNCL